MSKKPKFFCESCGMEVKQNDKVCTRCGKFFASVKCPSCGFAGDSRIFKDGCPACGYAVFSDTHSKNDTKKKNTKPLRKKGASADPLPWWIYVVVVSFLIIFIMYVATMQ